MQYIIYYLASLYGQGAYGASTYQNGSSSGGGTGSAASPGGLLTNTGFDLLLIATLASAIIFAALIIRFWRRPAKQQGGPANPAE